MGKVRKRKRDQGSAVWSQILLASFATSREIPPISGTIWAQNSSDLAMRRVRRFPNDFPERILPGIFRNRRNLRTLPSYDLIAQRSFAEVLRGFARRSSGPARTTSSLVAE